jgi:uncharacterized cofD-like protein
LGDPVAALDLVGRVVAARGRVLPMSATPLEIVADVVNLDPDDRGALVEVRGQVAVATTTGRVVGVRLDPPDPVPPPEVVAAITEAEWVVLGPGSWFTSVLPHLLVPELAKALVAGPARRLVVLNLAPQAGETEGFAPETHLEVLGAHLPELDVDVVLADEQAVPDVRRLRDAADGLGATLVMAPVACEGSPPVHDTERLAAALRQIFDDLSGDSGWR